VRKVSQEKEEKKVKKKREFSIKEEKRLLRRGKRGDVEKKKEWGASLPSILEMGERRGKPLKGNVLRRIQGSLSSISPRQRGFPSQGKRVFPSARRGVSLLFSSVLTGRESFLRNGVLSEEEDKKVLNERSGHDVVTRERRRKR